MTNLVISFIILTTPAFAAETLDSYKINAKSITVSGVSSGGYMAVQLGVAFSKTISGVGSVAGGNFWCAKGDLKTGQQECMGTQPKSDNINPQIDKAMELAYGGEIDDLLNLANQKVYIFASPKDFIIHASNSDRLQKFYLNFNSASNVKLNNSLESAHGFPTVEYGADCKLGFTPWLLKCGFDTAKEILTQMYGELAAKGTAVESHLIAFSQKDFGDATTPLFENGWVYVPEACAKGETCRLHVALHGCQMNPDFIKDQFVQHAGYNEWAETNNIIVLYPQSAKLAKDNPYACWDWFGFTGPNYVKQSGSQMAAIKKMIDRVRAE